jgi:hypothetical protein
MPVRQEQSPLDVARLHAVPLGEISNDHQELMPMVEAKAYSAWRPGNGSHFVKELPHADIHHSVTSRVEKREDRRRHRNRDAFEAEESLQADRLAPCVERPPRCSPHLTGAVCAYVSDGSWGLPVADRQKLRSREMAAIPRGLESLDQSQRRLILGRRQMSANQGFEGWVWKVLERAHFAYRSAPRK